MPGKPKKSADVRQRHETAEERPRKDLGIIVRPNGSEQPIPLPPSGLLKRSRQRWQAYWESQVAQAADPDVDLHRVERWIRAVDEYERVYPEFRKARISTGSTGQLTLHPLAGYLKQLEADIGHAEAELGLTPMARLRLGIRYAEARITAAQLNQALNQGDYGSSDGIEAELAGEWAEA